NDEEVGVDDGKRAAGTLYRRRREGGWHQDIIADGACPRPACTVQSACTLLPAEDSRMMSHLRRCAWPGAASLFVAAALIASVSAQKADKDQKDNPDLKRPQVKL